MPGIEVVSPSRHSAYGIRPEQGKCPAFAAKGNTAAQDQPQSLVCGPKPSPARLDRLEKPEMSEMCEGSPKSEGRSAPSAKLPKGSFISWVCGGAHMQHTGTLPTSLNSRSSQKGPEQPQRRGLLGHSLHEDAS